jgi:CopG family nickel-responsive transcriptional regulator
MARLVRFGVSIDKELIREFDRYISERDYSNRSEALRDLIRNNLIRREWAETGDVAGGISIVYDHHRRELVNKLLDIQHDYHEVIISTQHVHLSHEHCLEIIIVKGASKKVQALTNKLRSLKGVMHCDIARATTAEKMK